MEAHSSSSFKRSLTPSTPSLEEEVIVESHLHREESGNDIVRRLRGLESHNILYLADKDIVSKCDFVFNKDINGNGLIRKNGSHTSDPTEISELLLAGIFEVDARDFFMTSDAKYSSSNSFLIFGQVKSHCHLIPVRRDPEFGFSSKEFPTIIANIQAIEKSVPDQKGQDDVSIIVGSQGSPTGIKIIHQLFKEKKENEISDKEFSIDNWPVSPSNQAYLDTIKSTHFVNPIPAYDVLAHFHIRQSHKNVFNALLRDMTILRPPLKVASSTSRQQLHSVLHGHKKPKTHD